MADRSVSTFDISISCLYFFVSEETLPHQGASRFKRPASVRIEAGLAVERSRA
jgi:hypothetical protein